MSGCVKITTKKKSTKRSRFHPFSAIHQFNGLLFCVVWICVYSEFLFTFVSLLLVGTKISLFARIHAKTNYRVGYSSNEDVTPPKKKQEIQTVSIS